jgi:putative ABC transport system permease protein
MRPKAPKSGKRVILEKIPFIWNKLNFTTKVTVRNMFRYKKRFLMTIIGILGCTSMILFGFLLKDSVSNIVNNQYGKIFNYNFITTAKASLEAGDIKDLSDEISEDENVENAVIIELTSASITNGEDTEDVQVIVPNNNEEIYQLINFIDTNKEKVKISDNGVIITDKIASILGIKVGDNITIISNDDKEIVARVDNIVKNYVYHYMYVSKDLYSQLFDDYSPNALLIKTKDISDESKDELARNIMANSKVSSVTNIDSLKSTINNMMDLMKYVVWVLIVSAGLLAFVVLYNLATVNISERIRELATIKVLGFYDNEVYNYVSKETSILTFIGIVLGMGGGVILNKFILKTCEINVLRFEPKLNISSFVIAALITIVFTIIVNIATYFELKKINMTESLKSVE